MQATNRKEEKEEEKYGVMWIAIHLDYDERRRWTVSCRFVSNFIAILSPNKCKHFAHICTFILFSTFKASTAHHLTPYMPPSCTSRTSRAFHLGNYVSRLRETVQKTNKTNRLSETKRWTQGTWPPRDDWLGCWPARWVAWAKRVKMIIWIHLDSGASSWTNRIE